MLSNLQVCFNAVMPLFLIMGLGYGVKCLGGIRVEDVPGLNKMAFRFFMPVMLFWNLYTSSIDQALQPKLLLFAVGATLGMYGLSLAIVPAHGEGPREARRKCSCTVEKHKAKQG